MLQYRHVQSLLKADVGNVTAIQYVLLHEATHIVDATLEMTPFLRSKPGAFCMRMRPRLRPLFGKMLELLPAVIKTRG